MRPTRHQQGFAAVAAVFLVVVLAALGGYMVSFSNAQHLGSAQDVQGARAYWAARAGVDWGLASVSGGNCPASGGNLTVQGFSVVVTCSRSQYMESGTITNVLRLEVVASSGTSGSPGFVERSMTATVEQ